MKHFDKWVHHDKARRVNEKKHDKVRKSLDMNEYNRRSMRDQLPFHKAATGHREKSWDHRDDGEREARLAGHRAVYFMKKPKALPEPKNGKEKKAHYELRMNHLSRMHDLISDANQGGATYRQGEKGTARLSHYHDESASPGESRENAEIHAAVIKHHYPNAKLAVRSQGPSNDPDNHDRHTVDLTNMHALRAHTGSA